MDLPLIGNIDASPGGIFLLVAALIAVGYFGWQLFGSARPGGTKDAGDGGHSASKADADGDGGDGGE